MDWIDEPRWTKLLRSYVRQNVGTRRPIIRITHPFNTTRIKPSCIPHRLTFAHLLAKVATPP